MRRIHTQSPLNAATAQAKELQLLFSDNLTVTLPIVLDDYLGRLQVERPAQRPRCIQSGAAAQKRVAKCPTTHPGATH